MQIFSIGAEKELDKNTAKELAIGLGKVLESAESTQQKDVVEAINKVMTKSSKRDKKYAEYVIGYLQTLYPKINEKYPIRLNEE